MELLRAASSMRSWQALLLSVLLSWAGLGAADPRSYLDPQTAVTVTVMSEPLIFARDYPVLAANARDYLSVCALQVNRMGTRKLYFLVYAWSTLERRAEVQSQDGAGSWTLQADDREFKLTPVPSIRQSGLDELPCLPPNRGAVAALYPMDADSLAFIASSPLLLMRPGNSNPDDVDTYRLWKDRRAELRAFVTLLTRDGRPK
jgi:hypothetical protein